jgi:FkbM family methyltransferase
MDVSAREKTRDFYPTTDYSATPFYTKIYARVLFALCTRVVKFVYRNHNPQRTSFFSEEKHNKMVELAVIAEKIFSFLVMGIRREQRFGYILSVNYECQKLLMRPFILSEILMVSGLWEPYVKRLLDNEVSKDDVVVDVGANIGIHVIPLAKKVSKIIAFEPHPKTSEILEMNITLNRINNAVVVKKIVGNSEKRESYVLSTVPAYSGVASTNHAKMDSIIEVESVTLDRALKNEKKINWLLIDAEGFELEVLEGARGILLEHSPKIIIESLPQNIDKVSRLLVSAGYSVKRLYSFYYLAEIVRS